MLQFGELIALADALMLKVNDPVIEKCKEDLTRTPLASRVELIEKTASTIHLSDKTQFKRLSMSLYEFMADRRDFF